MAALGGSCLGVHVAFVRRARWLSVAFEAFEVRELRGSAREVTLDGSQRKWIPGVRDGWLCAVMAREDRAVRLAWCKTLAIEQHEQKTL